MLLDEDPVPAMRANNRTADALPWSTQTFFCLVHLGLFTLQTLSKTGGLSTLC